MFKPRKPTTPSSKNLKQAIACGIFAVFCFIAKMYAFAGLFLLMAGFNVHFYIRNLRREDEMKEKLDKLKDDDEEAQPQEQREADYNNFLNQLEEELGDFETDEDDE